MKFNCILCNTLVDKKSNNQKYCKKCFDIKYKSPTEVTLICSLCKTEFIYHRKRKYCIRCAPKAKKMYNKDYPKRIKKMYEEWGVQT